MKKRLAAAAAALSLALTGCAHSTAGEEIKLPIYGGAEISYEVAEAKYMDITETTAIAATIGYPYAANLLFPAEAQVVSTSVVNNGIVSEGDVLVELDSSALDYQINNQQTIVNAAYTASLSGGTSAQLQYQIEQITLDIMLREKDSYTLRAPFDGIVTSTQRVTEGDSVSEGQFCCSVSPLNMAAVYIDGADAARFNFGEKVQVKIDGKTYDATVVEAPDLAPDTAGTQRAVFDPGEGVLDEIYAENPLAISAGWATVYVTKSKENVLAVPDAAINSRGTSNYVTVVDGEERYKLDVTIGEQLGGYTEILNGISEGDVVMAAGSGVFTSTDNKDGGDNGDWGGDWNGEWNPDWGEPPQG